MKKLLSIILFLFTACQLMASAISFQAKLSHSVVEIGQRFRITFTVNSGGGNFQAPNFENFRLVAGPNQSSSTQIINGKMSQTYSISYILQATKAGKFEIGPATIVIDGETLQTQAQEIQVNDRNSSGANAQNQRQKARKNSGDQLSDYVYITAFVDKREAYVGENITVTYKLYSKLGLSAINLESLPAMNGFWSQDLRSVYDQIQLSTEYIDGEIYNTATLQQTLLYPQRAGELTIDPLSMKATVQVRSRRSRSLFESMFGSYERREIILSSDPIKIKAKALPPYNGKGEFSGAVGDFSANMKVNKTEIEANEAVDLQINISGKGNLPLIGAPKFNFPPDLEVYDPETSNGYQNSAAGSKGKKSYQYLLIPRNAGNFNLQPYYFTYFDLKSKSYKTIVTDSIELQVAKGENQGNVVYSGRERKEEVELLDNDIRYIHLNNLSLIQPDEQLYGSFKFYLILVLILLAIPLLYLLAKKQKAKMSDKVGLRKSKAKKLAKRRLAKASQHLKDQEEKLFYEELIQAIYGYFSDRYNISIAELTKEKVIEELTAEALPNSLLEEFNAIIEDAEMASYAPSANSSADTLLEKAEKLIEETESSRS